MRSFNKIVIVDDDYTNNLICEKVIKSIHITDEIISFLTVNEALAYLINALQKNELPELIFLDIYFDNEDGWDFLEEFRKNFKNVNQAPKIIILSSSVSALDVSRAHTNPHVNGFISKPLTENKLLKYLSQLS